MRRSVFLAAAAVLVTAAAVAGPAQQALLDTYAKEAGTTPSADRGRAFYAATHVGGKPETASCTSCHGPDPREAGRTRAGKTIEPLAVSKTPTRLTDPATAEKWFSRNCDQVLGRACTAAEKADVSAYLMSL
ncbi:MAG: DUF1924 domain-containing protein [Methylacidiphilales bacterium]|nr:DUF1924 domain-containing protein [Candidatus Methylacidiphilales bacterium]